MIIAQKLELVADSGTDPTDGLLHLGPGIQVVVVAAAVLSSGIAASFFRRRYWAARGKIMHFLVSPKCQALVLLIVRFV